MRSEHESFRYTVVDAITPDTEYKANIHIDRCDDGIVVSLDIPCKARIDAQQLAEIGGLFIALAKSDTTIELDLDSIGELLDGCDIPVPALLNLEQHI